MQDSLTYLNAKIKRVQNKNIMLIIYLIIPKSYNAILKTNINNSRSGGRDWIVGGSGLFFGVLRLLIQAPHMPTSGHFIVSEVVFARVALRHPCTVYFVWKQFGVVRYR